VICLIELSSSPPGQAASVLLTTRYRCVLSGSSGWALSGRCKEYVRAFPVRHDVPEHGVETSWLPCTVSPRRQCKLPRLTSLSLGNR